MAVDVEKLKSMSPPRGMDFHTGKLGHVVLQVTDLERATDFTPSKSPTSILKT